MMFQKKRKVEEAKTSGNQESGSSSEDLGNEDPDYIPGDVSTTFSSCDENVTSDDEEMGSQIILNGQQDLPREQKGVHQPLTEKLVVEEWNVLQDECYKKAPKNKVDNSIVYKVVVELCKHKIELWRNYFPYPARNDKESNEKIETEFKKQRMEEKYLRNYILHFKRKAFRGLLCSLVLKIAEATNQLNNLEDVTRKKLETAKASFEPKYPISWTTRLLGFLEEPKGNDRHDSTSCKKTKKPRMFSINLVRSLRKLKRERKELRKELMESKQVYEEKESKLAVLDSKIAETDEKRKEAVQKEADVLEFKCVFKNEPQATYVMDVVTKVHAETWNTQLDPDEYLTDVIKIASDMIKGQELQ